MLRKFRRQLKYPGKSRTSEVIDACFDCRYPMKSDSERTVAPFFKTRCGNKDGKTQQGTMANGFEFRSAKSTIASVAWSGWSPTTISMEFMGPQAQLKEASNKPAIWRIPNWLKYCRAACRTWPWSRSGWSVRKASKVRLSSQESRTALEVVVMLISGGKSASHTISASESESELWSCLSHLVEAHSGWPSCSGDSCNDPALEVGCKQSSTSMNLLAGTWALVEPQLSKEDVVNSTLQSGKNTAVCATDSPVAAEALWSGVMNASGPWASKV